MVSRVGFTHIRPIVFWHLIEVVLYVVYTTEVEYKVVSEAIEDVDALAVLTLLLVAALMPTRAAILARTSLRETILKEDWIE